MSGLIQSSCDRLAFCPCCTAVESGAAPAIAGLTPEQTQQLLGNHELMKARLVHEGQQRKQLLKELEQVKQMKASLKESVGSQEQVLQDLQVRVCEGRQGRSVGRAVGQRTMGGALMWGARAWQGVAGGVAEGVSGSKNGCAWLRGWCFVRPHKEVVRGAALCLVCCAASSGPHCSAKV